MNLEGNATTPTQQGKDGASQLESHGLHPEDFRTYPPAAGQLGRKLQILAD